MMQGGMQVRGEGMSPLRSAGAEAAPIPYY
jgi:hypothetical protein